MARGPSSVVNPERWVDDHGDCLYRYALLRVRRPEAAEDLVQETLCAAVRTYSNFRGKSSERSWLCGILKNKICDYFRKLGREMCFTDLEFLNGEMSPDCCPETLPYSSKERIKRAIRETQNE